MAEGRFPIVRATRTLPGRAPGVRARLDVSTGEGAVGQAISAVGGLISNLGLKWDLMDAKTQLSESNVKVSDAMGKFLLELDGNDDPNTYPQRLESLFSELQAFAPTNARAASVYNENIAERKLRLGQQTRQMAKKKLTSKSQAADFLMLQKAKQSGDFTAYKASVINGVKLGVYDAKEAESLLDDADEEMNKAEKNNALDAALAQRDDEGVLAVEKANEVVNDSEFLDADEKTDLLNQITNRATQEKNQRDGQFRGRMGDEAERLGKLLVDDELIEQEMDEVDLGGVGEQKIQEEEFKNKWKKILRDTITRPEPLISNYQTLDNLTAGSELVERGAKSPGEWETEFAEANADGELTEDDRRSLRSRDIVATKSMQNRTFTQTVTDNRSILVQARQGELAGLIEAREFALKSKDFKAADALNFNIKKTQIQEWNYGRYRTELRNQIAQNPEWSQKQIFVASDILSDQFDRDLNVLEAEFDNKNPQDAILTTPPDDEFSDIWSGLSQDDRAKVWEARLLGASTREILGEFPAGAFIVRP